MNLPNKITTVRMISVPFFLLFMLADFPYHYLAALILFIAACVTDFFDGHLARHRDMVTNFGKFLDPLVDKMLTTSAFLAILEIGEEHYRGILWIVFIILFREFAVMGIRLAAVSEGKKVIAADIFGKVKTVAQMISICFVIFTQWLHADFSLNVAALEIAGTVLLWLSAILTLLSGINYIKNNIKFISFKD